MYTLKMRSQDHPAERPEDREAFTCEAERLRQKGYPVFSIVVSTGGKHRLALEVRVVIKDLHRIKELGAETFFGLPYPNRIGVVFHNVLWFSPKWERSVKEVVDWQSNVGSPWQTTSHTEGGPFAWQLEADSTAKTVEVSGVGMVKGDQLYDFYEVLRSVERRLRIGRKLGQLVGLAKVDNWDGVERLRREILDQTFDLPL